MEDNSGNSIDYFGIQLNTLKHCPRTTTESEATKEE